MTRADGQAASGPTAFHVLAKPTGATCNLDCRYCFFLSKQALYPGTRPRMSEEVLEAYIRQLLESHQTPEVTVAWQGGEPTLLGLAFFQRALSYVDRYRKPGQRVLQTIQTNGVLLDDNWAAFFKAHGFLVGLSVDGPQPLHDVYRLDRGGRGTFDQVMRGWGHLRKHGVQVNILCAVHAANADHPLAVYRLFRDELGADFLQFIPIVERATPETLPLVSERPGGTRPLYLQEGDRVTDRSVTAEQYGRFLIGVFEEWVRRDVGRVFVQLFDGTLGAYLGRHSLCVHAPTCGLALALEHNGDLYACDHFVEPKYRLGNILQTPMLALITSEPQRRFGQGKLDGLPGCCRKCDVRFACHGGCPKDRFTRTPEGEPGLNYLCAGYRRFFRHVDRPMRLMADLLRRGRYADEILAWYTQEDARLAAAVARAGRNDPCPCGSGRKVKRCHGQVPRAGPSGQDAKSAGCRGQTAALPGSAPMPLGSAGPTPWPTTGPPGRGGSSATPRAG